MIQALIFDFDGLLVDTETPAFESWRMLFADHRQILTLDHWKDAIGTIGVFDGPALLSQMSGHPIDGPWLIAQRQALKQRLSETQPLLPGVLTILDAAAARGMPCAVASSSSRAWVEGWLQHHSIRERFVCVRTSDDVRAVKPAPDLFLSAAAAMQVPPSACLVFEDSPNGIRAAHAAGMRCVAVPGAITRQLELPPCDLRLERLDDLPLADLLNQFHSA